MSRQTDRQTRQPKPLSLSWQGFTLAELLISLAILGVIATFTIPKILTAQQNGQKSAQAKEAVAMIAQAYQNAQKDGLITTSTTVGALTPYLNYVTIVNTSIDATPNVVGSLNCNAPNLCIRLHNGGVILFDQGSFGGTGNLNASWFAFDPDGSLTSNTTGVGAGQSVMFWLYYSGRISEMGSIVPGTTNNFAADNPNPTRTPSWFSWN